MTPKITLRTWIMICAVLMLAFVYQQNFMHNFMKVGKKPVAGRWQAEVFETYQSDTAMHVPIMLQQVKNDGAKRLLYPMPCYAPGTETNYYPSCYGLQGKVAGLLWLASRSDLDVHVKRMQTGLTFLTGLILSLFLIKISREFGWITGGIFFLLSLSSVWMVFAARNLYHVFATCLMPFAYTWLRFECYADRRRSPAPLFVITGLLVFIRALCSYEYITNVILGATIGPVYFLILRKAGLRAIARWGIGLCLAGAAGFGAALALHLLQSAWSFGSFADGVAALRDVAFARSFGDDGGVRSAISNVPLLAIIDAYLLQNAYSIPLAGSRTSILLMIGTACAITTFLTIAAVAWFMEYYPKVGNSEKYQRLFALTLTTFWAMCCTFTWPLLMKGHMYHHIHMAPKLFYIPFLLTYGVLIGSIIETAMRAFWPFRPLENSCAKKAKKK